jgi:hypothetical protein
MQPIGSEPNTPTRCGPVNHGSAKMDVAVAKEHKTMDKAAYRTLPVMEETGYAIVDR